MKLQHALFLLALMTCGTVACWQIATSTAQQPQTQPQPSPQAAATPAAPLSPTQETNNRFVKQISESIAGRENLPAEQVFKNIQHLKGVPAGRLLRIMNGGYSRALGVACTHCHVEQDFSSDDKRPKRAAREMAVMHRSINEQLGKMQNLEPRPQGRAINCSTCHRGAINPMAEGR
ncbi:MAG TPA: c-type cytochrome [Pyrinomonadaceae bacterium]|nr:c-type cytochrome [Pyrinomonadaceae bacterium]